MSPFTKALLAHDKYTALDAFTQGYVDALLFSVPGNKQSLLGMRYTITALSYDAWEMITRDCKKFQDDNAMTLCLCYVNQYTPRQAGMWFYYTRNGSSLPQRHFPAMPEGLRKIIYPAAHQYPMLDIVIQEGYIFLE